MNISGEYYNDPRIDSYLWATLFLIKISVLPLCLEMIFKENSEPKINIVDIGITGSFWLININLIRLNVFGVGSRELIF